MSFFYIILLKFSHLYIIIKLSFKSGGRDMKEKIYRTKISDVCLKATLYSTGFHMKKFGVGNGIMAQIKHIHQHSSCEVFFVLEGSLNVTDEHGSHDYSNCAVIIPPCYNHYTVSDVENAYCFYFSITAATRENKTEEPSMFSVLEKAFSGNITPVALDDVSSFYVEQFAEATEKQVPDESAVHLLYLLFRNIFEKMLPPVSEKKNTATRNKYNSYIHIIDSCITENPNTKLMLDDLAAKLYLCPKQVSRIIKKEYGCSLSELINQRKLTIACMLLKQTNLSISHIASTVGYEYENYFFSLFKKYYGVSPLVYRENNK